MGTNAVKKPAGSSRAPALLRTVARVAVAVAVAVLALPVAGGRVAALDGAHRCRPWARRLPSRAVLIRGAGLRCVPRIAVLVAALLCSTAAQVPALAFHLQTGWILSVAAAWPKKHMETECFLELHVPCGLRSISSHRIAGRPAVGNLAVQFEKKRWRPRRYWLWSEFSPRHRL